MRVQNPTETVRDYNKRWKDLLIQLYYNINEQLLTQYFLPRLAQNIQRHISMDTFKTYEEALTKAIQVEMADDYPAHPINNRIDE